MVLQEIRDFLEDRGIGTGFIDSAGDFINERKFAIAAAILIAFVGAALLSFSGNLFSGGKTLTVKVFDNSTGAPLEAQVTIAGFSEVVASKLAQNGTAYFEKITLPKNAKAIVEKQGYASAGVGLDGSQDEIEVRLEREIFLAPPASRKKMLLFTSKSNLEGKYGAKTAGEVIAKARELAGTVNETDGIDASVVLIDDRESMQAFGAEAAGNPNDENMVLQAVSGIVLKEKPDFVLIVGGPRIIPFQKAANPLKLDPNGFAFSFVIQASPLVETDNQYAMLSKLSARNSKDRHFPDVALGRLPDGNEVKAEGDGILVEMLQHAIDAHRASAKAPAGVKGDFGTVFSEDSILDYYGKYAFAEGKNEWVTSPNFSIVDEKTGLENARSLDLLQKFQQSKSTVIILLHGNQPNEDQALIGMGYADRRELLALDPQSMNSLDFKGKAILIDSCWGASLDRRSDAALPTIALRKGALAFIGSTQTALSISRKSYKPVKSEGDLAYLGVANSLIYLTAKKIREGETTGEAFLEAKKSLKWGSYPEFLTTDEFVLYGDPTLKLGGRT